jgi:hypothetical protein
VVDLAKRKGNRSGRGAAKKPARKRDLGASATEIGRRCDLSRQRVGQLETEGVFKRNEHGRFDIDGCVIAYIRWLRDENRRGSKAAGASSLQDARMREIEQRIAREDGRTIEIEKVQAGVDQLVGAFRAELAGVAAASTRDLALRDEFDRHLNVAIERCRAGLEGMCSDLQAGRETVVDGEEADA